MGSASPVSARGNALSFSHVILTDVGRVRTRNEDLAAADASRGIFVLADGMGGHPAGDLASRLAVESTLAYLTKAKVKGRPRERGEKMRLAVLAANQAILGMASKDPSTAGMGTTLSVVWLGKNRAHVAHVGDSRIYRWRAGAMKRLTRDHTVVRELVERGELVMGSPEALRMGHILTQAVGLDEHVLPDVESFPTRAGDVFLLCSDGLSDTVTDEQMAALIAGGEGDLERAGRALVEAALTSGGHDNVTIVLARVDVASA